MIDYQRFNIRRLSVCQTVGVRTVTDHGAQFDRKRVCAQGIDDRLQVAAAPGDQHHDPAA